MCFIYLWVYLPWILYIHRLTQRVVSRAWLLSLSIMFLRLIHVVKYISISFLLWLNDIPLPPGSRTMFCLNACFQSFGGHILPRGGIAGSYVILRLAFWRTTEPSSIATELFYIPAINAQRSEFLHVLVNTSFSFFGHSYPTGVQWYLTAVLTCLTMNDGERRGWLAWWWMMMSVFPWTSWPLEYVLWGSVYSSSWSSFELGCFCWVVQALYIV